MFIVLGATGHVGGAVLDTLVADDHPVTGITHDDAGAANIRARGAQAAVVDVHDSDALRAVFRTGHRAFLLNPPADPAGDTNRDELRTVHSIADAVRDSGLEKVLVQSVCGARQGNAIGDLSVLWEFERAVAATGVRMAVNRGGYYYSNFDGLLDAARSGTLPTMFPSDKPVTMVAPADLGVAAARRLVDDSDDAVCVQGPALRTFADVAAAFADALGHPVSVETAPRETWEAVFRDQGFSAASARAYARMTAAAVDGEAPPTDSIRGDTTLEEYIAALVARSDGGGQR